MKCSNCGHIFEGNFCPQCGTKVIKDVEKPLKKNIHEPMTVNRAKEENPYAERYSEPKAPETFEQPKYTEPPKAPVYTQPVSGQQYQQNTAVPPYQYPQYPTKKPMSGGKIAAMIVGIVLAVVIAIYAVPFGFIMCVSSIDKAGEDLLSSQDSNAVYSSDETVDLGSFRYSINNISSSDTYEKEKAGDGYEFIKIDVIIKNITQKQEFVDADINCYVDDYLYDSINLPEYNRDLGDGKSEIVTFVYKVPKEHKAIELCFTTYEDFLYGRNFKFLISE
ncbi:MAG: DUF4352 domain-containing protein [Ruminococcus sp.]|nr:DUF4352 domain-containing protein [Ruminococcus sp.]